MAKVLVVVVFVLAVSCSSVSGFSLKNVLVNISGTWNNELGSTMVAKQIGRTIFGKYCTAVSSYHLQRPKFDFVGNIGTGIPTSIGWVVTFQGSDNSSISTSAWSGQLRWVDWRQVILTTWTLTAPPANDTDIWASTRVGKDTFYRAEEPDPSCTFN